MKKKLLNILKATLFFGLGASILYLIFRSQNEAYLEQCRVDGVPLEDCSLLDKLITDFTSANFFWLFMVLIAYTISNISRTARWQMLLRPLGLNIKPLNGFFTIMLGYFANLGFPRIGEFVRAGTLARYEKAEFEKVMGTVVVDRVIDVFSLLIAILLAFLFSFNELSAFLDSMPLSFSGTKILGILVVLGLTGFFLLFYFIKKFPENFLVKKILSFLEGVKSIRNIDRPFWFLFHSLLIWVMYFVMIWVGLYAFGPTAHLGATAGLLLFVVGSLGIVIPTPGGMGTYHALVGACLTFVFGLTSADSFSFANIIFFTIQIGANVLFGALALIVLPLINNRGK